MLHLAERDRNNCFGNGCCQTAIPGSLMRAYGINITGLGDQDDRACGSAFLVDQTSYDEQRFSGQFIYRIATFIPGCGNAVMMMDNGTMVTGRSTTCRSITHGDKKKTLLEWVIVVKPRFHIISSHIYNINLSLIGALEEKGEGCGSGFLVDETSYNQGSWNTTSFNIPVSFRWTLSYSDTFTCCDKYPFQIGQVNMLNGTTLNTRECRIFSSLGENPFLIDGCKDDDTECRKCKDGGGYCKGKLTIVDGDGVITRKFNCYHKKRTYNLSVILGVSISVGTLFLFGLSYVLYKWIKKTKEKRQRKRFFKRNGGLLLKQQEEAAHL
ncbi:hypothetical protein R6Q59_007768 [Mikania micrantha]